MEDLISIGTIGLIKAVKTFSRQKNIKLATYASRCIENEILMHLRKTANRTGTKSRFDEPLNTDWDGNELLLSDILGTDPDTVDAPHRGRGGKEPPAAARISHLDERERLIMKLRFGLVGSEEKTQKEVADMHRHLPVAISPGWKSASSKSSRKSWKRPCNGTPLYRKAPARRFRAGAFPRVPENAAAPVKQFLESVCLQIPLLILNLERFG